MELTEDRRIGMGLAVGPGQDVFVNGHPQDQASLPRWQFQPMQQEVEGAEIAMLAELGLKVQDGASLSAKQVQLGALGVNDEDAYPYIVQGTFQLHSSILSGQITLLSGGSFVAEASTLLGTLRSGPGSSASLADCTLRPLSVDEPSFRLAVQGGSVSLLGSQGSLSLDCGDYCQGLDGSGVEVDGVIVHSTFCMDTSSAQAISISSDGANLPAGYPDCGLEHGR